MLEKEKKMRARKSLKQWESLESGIRGLGWNPSSTAFWLCDPGLVPSLFQVLFASVCIMEKYSTHLSEVFEG